MALEEICALRYNETKITLLSIEQCVDCIGRNCNGKVYKPLLKNGVINEEDYKYRGHEDNGIC